MRTFTLRPWTPPCSLRCLAHASIATPVLLQAAATPDSGIERPTTTSVSVTPGAFDCPRAGDVTASASAMMSARVRVLIRGSPRVHRAYSCRALPEPLLRRRDWRRLYPRLARALGIRLVGVQAVDEAGRDDGRAPEAPGDAVDRPGQPLTTHGGRVQ